MKLGDRIRMIRARYNLAGTVVDVRDAEHLEDLATLGRAQALALSVESDLVRGIAVSYEFQDNGTTITPTAVLLEDTRGRWFDLYGREVEVKLEVNSEQLALGGAAAGNAYPD